MCCCMGVTPVCLLSHNSSSLSCQASSGPTGCEPGSWSEQVREREFLEPSYLEKSTHSRIESGSCKEKEQEQAAAAAYASPIIALILLKVSYHKFAIMSHNPLGILSWFWCCLFAIKCFIFIFFHLQL